MSTPSKELLSEVFNTTVKNIELDRGQTEVKIYRENTSCLGTYNIYELSHKCKEWALNKNYEIWSVSKNKGGEAQIEHFKNGTMAVRCGKTEPESIFQACEWILSQTKLQ